MYVNNRPLNLVDPSGLADISSVNLEDLIKDKDKDKDKDKENKALRTKKGHNEEDEKSTKPATNSQYNHSSTSVVSDADIAKARDLLQSLLAKLERASTARVENALQDMFKALEPTIQNLYSKAYGVKFEGGHSHASFNHRVTTYVELANILNQTQDRKPEHVYLNQELNTAGLDGVWKPDFIVTYEIGGAFVGEVRSPSQEPETTPGRLLDKKMETMLDDNDGANGFIFNLRHYYTGNKLESLSVAFDFIYDLLSDD